MTKREDQPEQWVLHTESPATDRNEGSAGEHTVDKLLLSVALPHGRKRKKKRETRAVWGEREGQGESWGWGREEGELGREQSYEYFKRFIFLGTVKHCKRHMSGKFCPNTNLRFTGRVLGVI